MTALVPAFDSNRRVVIDRQSFDAAVLAPAVQWLTRGGMVLFPTDTFYGLAADPTSSEAVAALFDVKGRDPKMAVPLIIESIEALERIGIRLGEVAGKLAREFWPGPLSLVVDAPSSIAPAVHGGLGTIAVRVPDDVVARALAGLHGGLVTATSANLSGRPPAKTVAEAEDVARDARVLVVDAGPTPGGAPSTIVDVRGHEPTIVRAGAIDVARVVDVARR